MGKKILFTIIPIILSIGIVPALHISEANAERTQICIDKVWIESTKGKIACVTPSTAEKLVERGWGTLLEDISIENAMDEKMQVLPSWNDGSAKNNIIEFVKDVTDKNSKNFVPVESRLATFDLDGTLMLERPQYFAVSFIIEGMRDQAINDPDLAKKSPYKEILANDPVLEEGAKVVTITDFEKSAPEAYVGISQKEFIEKANVFFNSNNPQCNVPYKKLMYQPMKELFNYLQENDFAVWIATESPVGFARSVSTDGLGIPPEKVIGTIVELKYDNDKRDVIRTDSWSLNVHENKPIFIQEHTGQLPLFACGNTMGDDKMLEAATFACIVDHDSDAQDALYRDDKVYSLAQKNGWTIISMKNDFRQVFPDGINCKVVD